MRKYLIVFTLLLLLGTVTLARAEDKYVQVSASAVEIRFSPARTAELIATARKGDIFRLSDEKAGWYAVYMFSGEERYIPKTSASIVTYRITVPEPVSRRRELYLALLKAEDRALADADRKYPPVMIQKNIEFQRILYDRFKLDVMHRFGEQTPIYSTLNVEGAKAEWWR